MFLPAGPFPVKLYVDKLMFLFKFVTEKAFLRKIIKLSQNITSH